MATIKGLWLFNQTIDVSETATWPVNWYSLYGSKPSGDIIKIEKSSFGNQVSFFNNSSRMFFIYSAKFGWNEGYRAYATPISFGDAEQTVPDAFYTWLTANATQQGGEEETTATATITYNGNVIATISDGQTATLPCEGKKMVGDIVIAYGVDAVNLISFTIGGTAYQAEEGMTWEQWVDSEYNTAGYKVDSNLVYKVTPETHVGLNGTAVRPSDDILSSAVYAHIYDGGSND